jgi:hypothetical protein
VIAFMRGARTALRAVSMPAWGLFRRRCWLFLLPLRTDPSL